MKDSVNQIHIQAPCKNETKVYFITNFTKNIAFNTKKALDS